MESLNFDPSRAFPFFLILLRVSGIITLMPIFGDIQVPSTVRILFSLVLSYFLFRIFPQKPFPIESLSVAYVFFLVTKEFFLGVLIGYLFRLAFHMIAVAAEAISQASGFGSSRMFNPMLDMSSSVIGDFFHLLVVFLFFAVNGDQLMLRVMDELMRSVPIGTYEVSENLFKGLLSTGSLVMQMAARIAGPFLFCILAVNAGIGLAGRFVPTLNVMALSFTLTLGISLWLVWAFLPFYVNAIEGVFVTMEQIIFEAVGALHG